MAQIIQLYQQIRVDTVNVAGTTNNKSIFVGNKGVLKYVGIWPREESTRIATGQAVMSFQPTKGARSPRRNMPIQLPNRGYYVFDNDHEWGLGKEVNLPIPYGIDFEVGIFIRNYGKVDHFITASIIMEVPDS